MKGSPLVVLFATVLVDMIGFGIVLPLLPFYAESMGAAPLQVTLLVASYSAMQLLAAPLWGAFSDRRGRRPLIVLGLFASAISYLIFGLAKSLPVLFLSRMAAGASGGTISVAQAYVADTTRAEERAKALGLLGAASGLGVMLGPAVGGFFSRWGLGMPGFVASVLCAGNAVAALILLDESRSVRADADTRRAAPGVAAGGAPAGEAATLRGWVRTMTRFPLSVIFSVYFLTISSFAAMTSVLALYAERAFGVGAQGIGLVFTVSGAVTVVVRGVLLGPLVEWLGEPGTARVGAASLSLALLLISVIPNAWWLGVTVTFHAIGTGTLFPVLASLVSRSTDADSQGSVLGGKQFIGGFGRVVGPLWAGVLFQGLSITSPFQVGAVLAGGAWMLALRIPAPATLATDGSGIADSTGGETGRAQLADQSLDPGAGEVPGGAEPGARGASDPR